MEKHDVSPTEPCFTQPYGVLIVLNKSLTIIRHSENIPALLAAENSTLLNTSITSYLTPDNDKDNLEAWLAIGNNEFKRAFWKTKNGMIPLWICIHQDQDEIILEIEVLLKPDLENDELLTLTQHIINFTTENPHQSLRHLLQITCEDIKNLTQYQHVLICQFDEADNSANIIAEASDLNTEPLLGFRFPESDIPEDVRSGYLDLPLRYIPSINTSPISVLTAKMMQHSKISSLNNSNLRFPRQFYINYFNSIGVGATSSVAIMQHHKLWGLIICLNKSPHYLSVSLRMTLLIIAKTLSSQILTLETNHHLHEQNKIIHIQSLLTQNITQENSLNSALFHYQKQLLSLVSATGMSIYSQGHLLNFGKTPTSEQVMDLIAWVQANHSTAISFVSQSLPTHYKPSSAFKDTACGLLAIKITSIEHHYLLFYKSEVIHTITWAGNKKSIGRAELGGSSRIAFDRWIETITDHSLQWTEHEKCSAEFIRSIITNKQLQDLLQIQAVHDPLTGLLNRLYLDKDLSLEIQKAKTNSQTLALMLIDIDFFKQFNDHFGHLAGDLVLKAFTRLLRETFAESHYIYRFGGEEFLILLPNISLETARITADQLRSNTKKLSLSHDHKPLPTITISIGIAMFPDHGDSSITLMESADASLYQAKSSGRDKLVVASINGNSAPTHQ